MAYKKHEWKARQGVGLNKFRDQNGVLYEFESAPDEVTEPGTPFSAEWMNEMEDGIAAAGITPLVSNAASGATNIVITENAPETVAANDNYRILFNNAPGAGAKLQLGSTGLYPILNNYTGAPIVSGDIPAGYTADIVFDGANYILLNALVVSGTPTGYAFFTQDGSFTVPNFVTAIKVSACAAGVGRYAGEYLIDQIYNVTPGQTLELTVGAGNTVIGALATLIAGTVASSQPTTKLGYAAGYNGGNAYTLVYGGYGGFGGAFGYGGGGGGGTHLYSAAGGGAGIGGEGGNCSASEGGTGGGTTGGAGADRYGIAGIANGKNALSGKLIYKGAIASNTNGGNGGDGSIYGAGGGGNGQKITGNPGENNSGGGGAAGGYGAGAGQNGGGHQESVGDGGGYFSDVYGQPSSGMVLIEWGGTVA